MISCPDCKTSFSPRYRICPRCGIFQPKLDDRMEYLADMAEVALDRGGSPGDVESSLVEEGVPALVAAEIVCARTTKVKRAERSYGLVRLLGGSIILGTASALALGGVLISPSRLGHRLLIAAALVGAAGARPFYLGVYSVLTGRERQTRYNRGEHGLHL
jgi:hypothetical protein